MVCPTGPLRLRNDAKRKSVLVNQFEKGRVVVMVVEFRNRL